MLGNNAENGIFSLTVDVLLHVSSYLDWKSVVNLKLTSTYFNFYINLNSQQLLEVAKLEDIDESIRRSFMDQIRWSKINLKYEQVRKDDEESNLLELASELNCIKAFEFLLCTELFNPLENLAQCLFYACENGNLTMVRQITSFDNFNVKKYGYKALVKSSMLGHCDIVKYLLTFEQMEIQGDIIYYAGRANDLRLLRYLLTDERIDPSQNNNDALLMVSLGGQYNTVKLLLQDERVQSFGIDDYAREQAEKYGYCQSIAGLLQIDMRNSKRD